MPHGSLALALIVALYGAGAAAAEPPSVSVTGEAEAQVTPDIALASLAIEVEKPAAEDAAAEDARIAKAVIDGLKSGGVAAADIQTTGLSLWPWRPKPSGPESFRATETITVKFRDLPKAGKLVGKAVANGGLYRGVGYDVSDRETREDALRVTAVENARHRAELYAKGAGLKLGPVRSIAGGGSGFARPPLYARRAEVSRAAPEPPVEAGLVTLQQSVQVSFDLTAP